MTLNNLGNVQRALNELEAARASFEAAARLYDGDPAAAAGARLVERLRTHANLAALVRREDSRLGWPLCPLAYAHSARACRDALHYRGKFHAATQRTRVQGETQHLFELHLQDALDLWEVSVVDGKPRPRALAEAVWAAEVSRSRELLDRLIDEELQPTVATARVTTELERARKEAEAAKARLSGGRAGGSAYPGERGFRMGSTPVEPTAAPHVATSNAIEDLAALEREKQAAEAALLQRDPELFLDRTFKPLSAAAIQALIPSDRPTAFVTWSLGPETSAAFILTGAEIIPVRLPEFAGEAAGRFAQEWLMAYAQARFQKDGREALKIWHAGLEQGLIRLHEAALQPVLDKLPPGIKRLVLSPHQVLHLLPLHACRVAGGRTLGEAYEVPYTPSFSLLHHCAARQRSGAGDWTVVSDPRHNLSFAALEGAAAARRLGAAGCHPATRAGGEATVKSFRAAAWQSRLVHYAGHAALDFQDPLASPLLLAEANLELRELFSRTTEGGGIRLPKNELTVVSGCETGLSRPNRLDDVHSFTTGFLYAGAPCVITTLWAIRDLSSALLMDRFYHHWLEERQTPAEALRNAQAWLRGLSRNGRGHGEDPNSFERAVDALLATVEDPTLRRNLREEAWRQADGLGEHPFASPVFWAPFTCNGLGYRRAVPE